MNKILGNKGVEVEGVKSATYGPGDRDKFVSDAHTLGLMVCDNGDSIVVELNNEITGEWDHKVGGSIAWSE